MKFVVQFDEVEEGPVDQETVEKWIEVGNVLPSTPLRNALIPQWKKAGEFECFSDSFKHQLETLEKDGGSVFDEAKDILGVDKKEEEKDKRTAFIYKYLPNPAPIHLRVLSATIDAAILGIIVIILFAYGVITISNYGEASTSEAKSNIVLDKQTEVIEGKKEEKEDETAKVATEEEIEAKNRVDAISGSDDSIIEEEIIIPKINKLTANRAPTRSDDTTRSYRRGSKWIDISTSTTYTCISGSSEQAIWCDVKYINKVFVKLFTVFTFITLLYLGISAGFFAQTYGMYVAGIFIAKTDGENSEVFCLRSFTYAIMLILTGPLALVMVPFNPQHRSLHEYLTGVQVIRVSAKPRS